MPDGPAARPGSGAGEPRVAYAEQHDEPSSRRAVPPAGRRRLRPAEWESCGVDQVLLEQLVQDTAWQLVFRQGTLDSAVASRILGVRAAVERTRWSDGRTSERDILAWAQAGAVVGERPNVPPSVLENLPLAEARLRVAPVERPDTLLAAVRVAWPRHAPTVQKPGPETPTRNIARSTARSYIRPHAGSGAGGVSGVVVEEVPPWWAAAARSLRRLGRRHGTWRLPGRRQAALPPVPPDCPPELLEKLGADIRVKVVIHHGD